MVSSNNRVLYGAYLAHTQRIKQRIILTPWEANGILAGKIRAILRPVNHSGVWPRDLKLPNPHLEEYEHIHPSPKVSVRPPINVGSVFTSVAEVAFDAEQWRDYVKYELVSPGDAKKVPVYRTARGWVRFLADVQHAGLNPDWKNRIAASTNYYGPMEPTRMTLLTAGSGLYRLSDLDDQACSELWGEKKIMRNPAGMGLVDSYLACLKEQWKKQENEHGWVEFPLSKYSFGDEKRFHLVHKTWEDDEPFWLIRVELVEHLGKNHLMGEVHTVPVFRPTDAPPFEENPTAIGLLVTLPWKCPVCGGPRGPLFADKSTVLRTHSTVVWCDRLSVDQSLSWVNPCGHAEDRMALWHEALEQASRSDYRRGMALSIGVGKEADK